MVKRLILIFVLAFFFNAIWEHLHSVLYVHYRGGEITQLVLLRAALFDASFIATLSALVLNIKYLSKRIWIAVFVSVLFAIALEIYAIQTGRWAYDELMPIIPIIDVGLTPIIQLGLLFYLSFKISGFKKT